VTTTCLAAGFHTAESTRGNLRVGGPFSLGSEYAQTFVRCVLRKLIGRPYKPTRDSITRATACSGVEEGLGQFRRRPWMPFTAIPLLCGNYVAYALDWLWKSGPTKVVVIVARTAP